MEDLIKFMKSCHSSRTPDDGPGDTCRRSELPTAALVTGKFKLIVCRVLTKIVVSWWTGDGRWEGEESLRKMSS